MVYTHVNSKGVQRYLNKMSVSLHGGKTQDIYFFSRDLRPTASDLPSHVVVNENPGNGFLSVRRIPQTTLAQGAEGTPSETATTLAQEAQGTLSEAAISLSLDLHEQRSIATLAGLVHDSRGRSSEIELQAPIMGSSYSSALVMLRKLIEEPDAPEAEFQELLEVWPEMIPGDYLEARGQLRFESPTGNDLIPDLVLRPVSGWSWDIAELKLPKVPLITKVGNRVQLQAKVQAALQQLRAYAEAANDEWVADQLRVKHGVEMYRPRLQLIIGRSSDLNRRDFERAAKLQAPDVLVHTWDDVAAIAQTRLRRASRIS